MAAVTALGRYLADGCKGEPPLPPCSSWCLTRTVALWDRLMTLIRSKTG